MSVRTFGRYCSFHSWWWLTDISAHRGQLEGLIFDIAEHLLLLTAFAESDDLTYLRWFLGNMAGKK